MKIKALVRCMFEIEYEDRNTDMRDTVENICMSRLDEIIDLETDESIQCITVLESYKSK